MNKPNDKVDLNKIMKRAQDIQKELQELQKQVTDIETTGQSGGGAVKITITGQHYAKKVILDPATLKEPKSVIEDLIAAAINDATDKNKEVLRDKMSKLAGTQFAQNFNETS
jgi:nucleoid-associated protein EbfC